MAPGAACATVALLACDNGANRCLQRAHTVRGSSPGAIPHRAFSLQPSVLHAFILSVLSPWRNLSTACLLCIVCRQILVTVTQLIFHPTDSAQSLLKPVPCGRTGHCMSVWILRVHPSLLFSILFLIILEMISVLQRLSTVQYKSCTSFSINF